MFWSVEPAEIPQDSILYPSYERRIERQNHQRKKRDVALAKGLGMLCGAAAAFVLHGPAMDTLDKATPKTFDGPVVSNFEYYNGATVLTILGAVELAGAGISEYSRRLDLRVIRSQVELQESFDDMRVALEESDS